MKKYSRLLKWLKILQKSYGEILDRSFQRLRYKNIRSIKIRKFPYDLYFFINEERQNIRILSCFHKKETLTIDRGCKQNKSRLSGDKFYLAFQLFKFLTSINLISPSSVNNAQVIIVVSSLFVV